MNNPYLNAVFAAAYIVGLVLVINTIMSFTKDSAETVLIPMTMLSLFVLSAAVMGFLFMFRPAQLYIDGAKKEAIQFFGKTVATFACFAVLSVIALVVAAKMF